MIHWINVLSLRIWDKIKIILGLETLSIKVHKDQHWKVSFNFTFNFCNLITLDVVKCILSMFIIKRNHTYLHIMKLARKLLSNSWLTIFLFPVEMIRTKIINPVHCLQFEQNNIWQFQKKVAVDSKDQRHGVRMFFVEWIFCLFFLDLFMDCQFEKSDLAFLC